MSLSDGGSPWHGEPQYSLLLVCSNAAIMPGVVLAYRHRFIPEMVHMLVTATVSILYHLCQSHVFCMFQFGTMQIADHINAWSLVIWMAMFATGWPLWTRVSIMFAVNQVLILGMILFFENWILQLVLAVLTIVLLVVLHFTNDPEFRAHFHLTDMLLLGAIMIIGIVMFAYGSAGISINNSYYWWTHSLWHLSVLFAVSLVVTSNSRLSKHQSYVKHAHRETGRLLNDVVTLPQMQKASEAFGSVTTAPPTTKKMTTTRMKKEKDPFLSLHDLGMDAAAFLDKIFEHQNPAAAAALYE